MLTRDQQQLLAAVGPGMAADSLLDRLRDRGTLEGGCSAPQPGRWIDYDRKGVRLEDHSEIYAAFRSPDDESPQAQAADQAAWRRIKRRCW